MRRLIAITLLALAASGCAENQSLRAFDRAAAMGLAALRAAGPCIRINDNPWNGTRITEVRC